VISAKCDHLHALDQSAASRIKWFHFVSYAERLLFSLHRGIDWASQQQEDLPALLLLVCNLETCLPIDFFLLLLDAIISWTLYVKPQTDLLWHRKHNKNLSTCRFSLKKSPMQQCQSRNMHSRRNLILFPRRWWLSSIRSSDPRRWKYFFLPHSVALWALKFCGNNQVLAPKRSFIAALSSAH
jgi:hypothetical protein